MSRMLEALKQIKAKSPPPRQQSRRASSEPGDGQSSCAPAQPSETDRLIDADEAIDGIAAIEEELAKIDGPAPSTQHLSQQTEVAISDGDPSTKPRLAGADCAIESAFRDESRTFRLREQLTDEPARVYGELADNILAQLPTGRPARLLFTSPGDGEGKTAMLSSLAMAFVERIPGDVLLVGAEPRTPDVPRPRDFEPMCGLSDVLLGVARWQEVVQQTEIPRLSVLPGLRFPTPDSRTPEQWNVGPLLRELGDRYHLVLIDSASPVDAEVAPLARCCDGTYLVVRLGHSSRRTVAEAVRAIRSCGGRMLGGVVIEDG